MTAKILESFGSKFAEQWIATLLTPAFIFWLGGLITISQRLGWQTLIAPFKTQPQPLQIAILIGCFCIIAASAFIVQRFDRATLRFLEGYWHPLLYSIRQWRTQYYQKRKTKLEQDNQTSRIEEATQKTKLQTLERIIETQGAANLTNEQLASYRELNEPLLISKAQEKLSRIRQQLRAMPIANPDLMPTRLGNILRSAERAPLQKYGLDAIICWSRLWMLLPDAVKKDLQEARTNLNNAARVWLWSILFCCIWTFVSCWLLTMSKSPTSTSNATAVFLFLQILATTWQLILGSLSATFAYNWALEAASTYGELIEAAFDLHRHLLYQSIRWNIPPDPDVEKRVGQELTQYLRRRS
jgi:hypothetical protein